MKPVLKKALVAVFIIAAVAAGLWYAVLRRPAPKEEAAAPTEASAPAEAEKGIALPVKVAPAVRGDLVIRLTAPGEVFARKKASIKAEVAGAIMELPAEEGKAVRAREVLAAIDDRGYVLRLDAAEAERLKRLSEMLVDNKFGAPEKPRETNLDGKIEASAAALESASSAYAEGRIGRAEFEKARKAHESLLIEAGRKKEEVQAASKGLTQAEVQVAEAKLDLERTKVRAPFSGVLTGIKASVGETVNAGQDLMTLVDVKDVLVEAHVLESEAGRMRLGREVELRFSSYPNRVFKGRVRAMSPVIEPADRTRAVHIAVDDPEGEIKPGMHAEADIAAEVHPGRLLVPQEAVLVRGGRKLVFVVEEGTAKWRYVTTGLENDRFVEILEGITEGESVIVEGHLTLAHDAKVKIE